jgi:hypothetical protein
VVDGDSHREAPAAAEQQRGLHGEHRAARAERARPPARGRR